MNSYDYLVIDERIDTVYNEFSLNKPSMRSAEFSDAGLPPGGTALDSILERDWIEVLGALGKHGWELCASFSCQSTDGHTLVRHVLKRSTLEG